MIAATQLVDTVGTVDLSRLGGPELTLFEHKARRSIQLEPPVFFQITKLRVGFFEKPHSVQKVEPAHVLEVAKLRVAFSKKPQAVQKVGTPLFRSSFPGLLL